MGMGKPSDDRQREYGSHPDNSNPRFVRPKETSGMPFFAQEKTGFSAQMDLDEPLTPIT
jgi:hypothetical protein